MKFGKKGLKDKDGENKYPLNLLEIHHAIENEDDVYLMALLDAKADPNCLNEFGLSALRHSIRCHSLNITKLLIIAKANVNDSYGAQSILYTSWRVHCPEISKILLQNGALPFLGELDECNYPQMESTYRIMQARIAHCRMVVIWLLKFRFPGPRDCHVDWIKKMVWSTRHASHWAPDWKMPSGFED